jgi:acetyl-CoA acetyltransferase family protein
MAFHAIKAGEGDVFVSAGVETVSRFRNGTSDHWPNTQNPLFADAVARTEKQAEGGQDWHDPREDGTVPDAYIAMGQTAENVADEYKVSREDQDLFAFNSQRKATAARQSGRFEREIAPVTIPPEKKGKEAQIVAEDEFIRPGTTIEVLSKLKPAFRTDGKGSVTAGNSSGINDGAAAMLVAGESAVERLKLDPMVRIVTSAAAGVEPRIMGMGPVPASRIALERAGLTLDQMDVIELNEAFASQSLACLRELGIADDDPRVNPNGGAIALGHPLGMSGARLLLTAAHQLKQSAGKYALCTMCIGVGQGMATIIERV